MEKLNCKACGSNYIRVQGNVLVCESCDSRFERTAPQPERSGQAEAPPPRETIVKEGFYPFTVEEAACEKALRKWFVAGDDMPEDLVLYAKITSLRPVFVPAYFFHVDYSANNGMNRGAVLAGVVANKQLDNRWRYLLRERTIG